MWDAHSGTLQRTIATGSRVWSVAFGMDGARRLREAQALAFSMGQLERLGARSPVRELDPGVVRLIVEILQSRIPSGTSSVSEIA